MIRTILVSTAVGAALSLAGHPAQAVTPLPALKAPVATAVEKVVWVCGPVQCVWDPTPDPGYVAPAYATTWAAPLYPSCFWKRGFFGRWKMICP